MAPRFEVWQMCLTTRSPVHIGGAVAEVGPLEVAVHGRRAYRVAEDRLIPALAARGLADAFVLETLREAGSPSLHDFLSRHGLLNDAFLKEVAVSSARLAVPASREAVRKFRPFIRDGRGRPYIPGSSIKGALRTAILYMTLARIEERDRAAFEDTFLAAVDQGLDKAWAEVEKRRTPSANTLRLFSRTIQQQVLASFRLRWRGRRKPEHQRATPEQRDVLRCLKVSDSAPFDPHGLEVREVRVLSLRTGDREAYLKDPPLYVECLPAGATLTFTLTLDRQLLDDLRAENPEKVLLTGLEDVLNCAREFSRDVIQWERDYLSAAPLQRSLLQWYQEVGSLDLRLGWGSGWHATTIGLLLGPSRQAEVRDLFFAHKRQSRYVPKSRRVVVEGSEPVCPLGWVSLERVG